jgi:hypothetical protein
MLLNLDDGIIATPEETEQLKNAGYQKCYNPQCEFHISPEAQQKILNEGHGYYTCPKAKCNQSHDLMEDMPWHGADIDYQVPFSEGGTTRIGLNMEEQAQIGEDLIKNLNSLPGYGPIISWHPGNAGSQSPLDGTTREWGIEVKTIGYDAIHHRFIPGRVKEKEDKNNEATLRGLKGVLGILVMLNYKSSKADIYVKEMPLIPWKSGTNTIKGVATFRTNTAEHLLAEVPFPNPFLQPNNPVPHPPTQAPEDLPF